MFTLYKHILALKDIDVFKGFRLRDTKAAFEVITEGIGGFIKAHPVLTSLAATFAALKAVDTFVFNADEKLEKATSAVGEYQNTVSELESVESELQNINARMDELNSKGHLSLVESDELNKLQRSNDELERRRNILSSLEEGQFAAAKNEVANYLSDRSTANQNFKLFNPYTWKNSARRADGVGSNVVLNWLGRSGIASALSSLLMPGSGGTIVPFALGLGSMEADKNTALTPIESINSYLDGIVELQGKIAETEEKMTGVTDPSKIETYNKEIAKYEKTIEDYKSVISTDFDDIANITDNFNADYFNPDDYNDFLNAMGRFDNLMGSSGKTKESKIEGLLAKDEYEGLKDRLVNLAKQGKLTAEVLYSTKDGIDKFFSDISSKNVSADDIVQYFNALADPDSYNFDNIRKQFKETLISATDKTFTPEQRTVAKEYEQVFNEIQKLKQEGADLTQTIFGNIDTNHRQVLEWTDENLKAYKKAIKSWGETPEDLAGNVSTVFGAYEDFGDDEHPLNIAFSPMLQTENGAVLLSKGTVEKYIESLIKKAGAGGREWTSEDLFKLDAEGLDVDGRHIKNIIADIGDTAEQTSKLMHFQGKDGAMAMSLKEIENVAKETGLSVKEVLDSVNDGAEEFVDNLSEKELEAYVTLKASTDTSEWDLQTWKSNIEKQLEIEAKVDIKATPKLDEFTQAQESDNSGKNYDTIVSSLESVKRLYEGGLVGTDDFLSFAKLISPNDVATVSEYEKYVGNIAKYFTEDYKGLEAFKKDLDAKGLAEYNSQTGKLETTFKNTSEAAREMGMSTETFVMAMQKLDEFGYDIKIFSNEEEAKNTLDKEISSLADLYAKREALKTDDNGNTIEDKDLSEDAKKQLSALDEEILQVQDDLAATRKEYENLILGGNDNETTLEGIKADREAVNRVKNNELYSEIQSFNSMGLKADSKGYEEYKNHLEELAAEINGSIKEINENGQIRLEFVYNGESEDDYLNDIDTMVNYASAANDKLKELEETDHTFNFSTNDINELEDDLEAAQEIFDSFKGADGKIDLTVEGAPEAQSVLTALLVRKQELEKPTIMKVDVSNPESEAEEAVAQLQKFQSDYNNRQIKVQIGADTTAIDKSLQADLDALSQNTIITGSFNIDTTSVGKAAETIKELTPEIMVNAGVDTSKVEAFEAEDREEEGTVVYNVDDTKVKAFEAIPRIGRGTIYYSAVYGNPDAPDINVRQATPGRGLADGNAHFGDARAKGSLGEKKNGKVLVGEQGNELIVRSNKYFTVGNNGAEFVDLKKDDIVFNHKQTEELFKNGHISSRGKTGSARAYGSTGSGSIRIPGTTTAPKTTTTTETKTTTKTTTDSSKKDSESTDKYYNYFAAILKDRQKAVEKFEKELERLNEKIEVALENNDMELYQSLMGDFSDISKEYRDYLHNSAEELRKLSETEIYPIVYEIAPELKGQKFEDWSEETLLDIQKRLDEESAKLEGDESSAAKLKREKYEALSQTISDIYDAAGNINGEGEFAEKWADNIKEIKELAIKALDEIEQKYDRMLSDVSESGDLISHNISMTEARGYEANDSLKRQLIENKEQQKEINLEKAESLQLTLDELVAEGRIVKGSDDYYDYLDKINSAKSEALGIDEEIAGLMAEMDEYVRHNSVFETMTDVLQSGLDLISKTASSAFKSFSTKKGAIADEVVQLNNLIGSTNSELEYQKQVFDSLNIPEEYINLIKSGSLDPLSIDDTALSEEAQKGINVWNRIIELQQTAADLAEDLSQKYKDMFDNVEGKFQSILNQLELNKNLLDKAVSISEAQGLLTSTKYYEEMTAIEKENGEKLRQERDELVKAMKTAISEGNIEKGSDAWNDMQSEINSVTEAIWESDLALKEYANDIRDLNNEVFDYMQDSISRITDEADFLIDLMENDKLFDDDGKLTDKGLATMGLHGLNYNTYSEEAKKYAEEIEDINREIENNPYDTKLIERKNELVDAHQEAILAAENEKKAIKDLISDGYDKQIDALEEVVDKYLDALRAGEDLYDYYKSVKNKTKEIASLQKQLGAYANDNSEETKAKLQELKVSLEEAQEDLADIQHKQYISDLEKLMDNLLSDYERVITGKLDETDAIITDLIANINSNSSNIRDTLYAVSEEAGYTLSDNMAAIWSPMADETGRLADVLTTYSNNMAASMTSLQGTVENVVSGIKEMIAASNSLASSLVSQAARDSEPVRAESGSDLSSNNKTSKTDNATTSKTSNSSSSSKSNSSKTSNSSKGTADAGTYATIPEAYAAAVKKLNTDRNGNADYDYVTVTVQRRNDAGKILYTTRYKLTPGAGQLTKLAKGTKYVPKTGAYIVDDGSGQELIAHKSAGRVTSLETGDRVFNADETSNIAKTLETFSQAKTKSLAEIVNDQLKTLDEISAQNGGMSHSEILRYMAEPYFPEAERLSQGLPPLNQNLINSNSGNMTIQIGNITLPNVKSPEDFYSGIMQIAQRDGNFEKMVQSMTIDRLAGKSSFAKRKYNF